MLRIELCTWGLREKVNIENLLCTRDWHNHSSYTTWELSEFATWELFVSTPASNRLSPFKDRRSFLALAHFLKTSSGMFCLRRLYRLRPSPEWRYNNQKHKQLMTTFAIKWPVRAAGVLSWTSLDNHWNFNEIHENMWKPSKTDEP